MMFETCKNCGTAVIPRRCLACGTLIDAHRAADLSGNCPKTGDVSVCLYCVNIAIFTNTGLRELTADERESVLADEELNRAVIAVREMHEQGLIPDRGGQR